MAATCWQGDTADRGLLPARALRRLASGLRKRRIDSAHRTRPIVCGCPTPSGGSTLSALDRRVRALLDAPAVFWREAQGNSLSCSAFQGTQPKGTVMKARNIMSLFVV